MIPLHLGDRVVPRTLQEKGQPMPRGMLPVGRPDRDVQNFRYLMQRRLMACVTTADMDEMLRAGIAKVKDGDAQWAGLLFPWLLGKAPKEDDASGAGITVGGDMTIMISSLPPEQIAALAALKNNANTYKELSDTRSDEDIEEGTGTDRGTGGHSVFEGSASPVLPSDESPS